MTVNSPSASVLEKVPSGFHRHAAPCGPWPWKDYDYEDDAFLPSSIRKNLGEEKDDDDQENWTGYPTSHFPNWTAGQVKRSGIADSISSPQGVSKIYRVNVRTDGSFVTLPEHTVEDTEKLWHVIKPKDKPNIRIRAFFIENLAGPVLQIFGARFNIEPFFYSSSLNWIPSRFQASVKAGVGDNITIILPFLRCLHKPEAFQRSAQGSTGWVPRTDDGSSLLDARKPLFLSCPKKLLLLDLMSINLVRGVDTSTFISYHAPHRERTTARRLHSRARAAGASVYWQHIWTSSSDSTFFLLAMLWHTLYAWDEALEALYDHFSTLEATVMRTKDLDLTQELYVIRAHLLHWVFLLDDLRKTVEFIDGHPNPNMNTSNYTQDELDVSNYQLKRELGNMKTEIERLEKARDKQDKRLKNAMDLVFATVNIDDSNEMKELTKATVKDSAAMKLIAILTLVYLPPTFATGLLGMNIGLLNPGTLGTVGTFLATALSLTTFTIYTVMVWQTKHSSDEVSLLMSLLWPIYYLRTFWHNSQQRMHV